MQELCDEEKEKGYKSDYIYRLTVFFMEDDVIKSESLYYPAMTCTIDAYQATQLISEGGVIASIIEQLIVVEMTIKDLTMPMSKDDYKIIATAFLSDQDPDFLFEIHKYWLAGHISREDFPNSEGIEDLRIKVYNNYLNDLKSLDEDIPKNNSNSNNSSSNNSNPKFN